MRKARKVEIPEDGILENHEYENLKTHAYNSAVWYATNYSKTSNQIRQKLFDKGFPNHSLEIVKTDGTTFDSDIVSETVERLQELSFLDDRAYTENVINSGLRSGKSLKNLKTKLFQAGIPKEMVEDVLLDSEEENEEAENEALNRTASKLLTSSSYRKLEHHKQKEKLIRTLMTKGFQYSDIAEWVETHVDIH